MANKKLSATITIGGAVASSLKSAFGAVTSETNKVGSAVRSLERQQRMLSNSIMTFGKMGKNIDGLRMKYAAVTAELNKLHATQRKISAAQAGMAAGKARMAGAATGIGVGVAAAATAFIPVAQAASFEKAMLGVAKQVDGARDSSGKLTQVYFDMAKQIQLLGREIPIATNDIAEMVAAGARMGVARKDLIEFTRTAAMMAEAFELPADELADSMGKIAGLYKIPIPAIGELADAINYLDDNAISKGGDIIDFLTRTGGAAASVKVTGKEMAALGSTLLTLGERTETAGTAINAAFAKLAAADKGTKKFRSAVAELGMTTEQIQKGMQSDAVGTLMNLMKAIGKLKPEKQLGVLVELFGVEHADTMAKLAQNTGEFARQLGLANGEAAKGSMSREFSARMQTVTAQWEVFKNVITEVGVSIGAVLLPPLNDALQAMIKIGGAVSDWVGENQLLVENILTIGGVLGGAMLAFKTFSLGIGAVTFAFNALKLAMATNPIGLLLVALTTAGVLIYENWEPLKAFFSDLWDSIKSGAESTWEFIRDDILAFTPLGPIIKNWEPIRFFMTNLFEDITAMASKAMDWIIGKIEALGNVWRDTKAFFGFGDDSTAPAAQPTTPAPALPVPAMATAGGMMAPSYTDQSTNTFQIVQQPGENADALARRISDEQERRRAVQRRSMLMDGAVTQ